MAPQTMGFANVRSLNRHFQSHGSDFGTTRSDDYERLADSFMGNPLPSGVQEYRRNGGDILRYDPTTESFGVKDANDFIRTFYKPVPCSSLPASIRSAFRMAGKCHPHPDNQSYVIAEASKW